MKNEARNLFDLTDRVAIVTGGAGFLGKEFARTLAHAGAHVVVADIDHKAAETVARELSSVSKTEALAVQTDVTNNESVRAMVAMTKDVLGRVDILVNSAALDPKFDPKEAGKHVQTFEDYPLEAWQKSLDVDLTGAFLCTQAVTPIMREQKSGAIVNVSSIYGVAGPDQRLYEKDDGSKGMKPPSYSATKAALDGFTRYLATYFAGMNIRVNTLILGGVFKGHDEQFTKRYNARVPMGRMMKLEEVGGPLLFLVSDASSYMTGANLVVDGGWTAW
ncbi:MAG: putative oxidoreductase [Parcubacteria group bacterium Gr01-1014_106]|nr:MAG: putative oxidoreductase [Parcubacteria group bacterium Gr01-1014_106]